MSYSARLGLPRTRSLRRVRGRGGWGIAIVTALVVNLLVIVALGQASRLAAAPPPPPLLVHRLTRIDPEPPPPPQPVAEPPAAPSAELASAPVPVAMPLLDLPADGPGLTLPALGSLDVPVSLPMAVPAFAAIAPDGPAFDAGPAIAIDEQAVRDGDIDLDRFYPRAAKARGITGSSRIRSHIDASGRVTAVEVLESQPPGVFEQAAERLGRAQRYSPARRAGVPVATVQDTVIAWKLQ